MGCQVITALRKDGTKRTHINSQKTEGFRTKMRVGAAIANQMPTLMSPTDCAKIMGISTQMLRRIECLALAKVSARLQEIKAELEA